MLKSLVEPWLTIERLQGTVARGPGGIFEQHGRDDALAGVVDELASIHFRPERLDARYVALRRNRRRKHKQRHDARIKMPHLFVAGPDAVRDPESIVGDREMIRVMLAVAPELPWRIFGEIANDTSFNEIAAREGIKVGTLKSMVSRGRARARDFLRTVSRVA